MSVYDPKKVIMAFGPLPILGFAKGSMIEVTMSGDGARAVVGAQGEGVIVLSHDNSGEIKIRLLGTGAGRNTLAALTAHYNAGNLALPIGIGSRDTGAVLAAGQAALKNRPDMSFGDEEPVVEVMFVSPEIITQIVPEVP